MRKKLATMCGDGWMCTSLAVVVILQGTHIKSLDCASELIKRHMSIVSQAKVK